MLGVIMALFNPANRQFQIRVLIPMARAAHHPFFPSKIWNPPAAKRIRATAPSHDKIPNLKYATAARISAAPQQTSPLIILALRPLASMLHRM
jgi:hypothetical protein